MLDLSYVPAVVSFKNKSSQAISITVPSTHQQIDIPAKDIVKVKAETSAELSEYLSQKSADVAVWFSPCASQNINIYTVLGIIFEDKGGIGTQYVFNRSDIEPQLPKANKDDLILITTDKQNTYLCVVTDSTKDLVYATVFSQLNIEVKLTLVKSLDDIPEDAPIGSVYYVECP